MRLAVNIDHIATLREARKSHEPEPVAAEVAEEPTPLAPPTPIRPPYKIRPISETIIQIPRSRPALPTAEPAAIDDEALAARRAQLDVLGIDDPGMGKVGPARNVVPYRSSGAGVSPSELVQRTLGGPSALWDASAREVASARSAVAVQNCGSCGTFCQNGHPCQSGKCLLPPSPEPLTQIHGGLQVLLDAASHVPEQRLVLRVPRALDELIVFLLCFQLCVFRAFRSWSWFRRFWFV